MRIFWHPTQTLYEVESDAFIGATIKTYIAFMRDFMQVAPSIVIQAIFNVDEKMLEMNVLGDCR
jgi:hypothetical protein